MLFKSKPWCFPKPNQVVFVPKPNEVPFGHKTRGIWMHLLSTEVNGKEDNLTLAYALHAISSCKSRVICTHIKEIVLHFDEHQIKSRRD